MFRSPPTRCIEYNTLSRVDALEWQLQQLPDVVSTQSFAGLTKRYAVGLNEGNFKWYELPRTPGILNAIAALGDFAGTDETANTFRQGYSTALKTATTYVNALRDVYPGIAERLAGMKTNFDVANWANIQSLPKVSDLPEFSESDGKLKP